MKDHITPLCAGCGRAIDNDSFGLCAECEEKIQQTDSTWSKIEEQEIEETYGSKTV